MHARTVSRSRRLGLLVLFLAAWLTPGCTSKEALLYDGLAVISSDPVRAMPLFAKACDKGSMEACWRLGQLMEKANGKSDDHPTAAELYRRACSGDQPFACVLLATLTLEGRGVERDPKQAAQFAKRGCMNGEARACIIYGGLIAAPRAATFFEKSCQAGTDLACLKLGELFDDTAGVEHDYVRAATAYQRSCELSKGALGCDELARLHERGALREDPVVARALRDASCRAGSSSCNCALASEDAALAFAAAPTLTSEGVEQPRSRRSPRLSCLMESCVFAEGSRSCARFVELVNGDPAAGAFLREDAKSAARKGCDLGNTALCQQYDLTPSNFPKTTEAVGSLDEFPEDEIAQMKAACDGQPIATVVHVPDVHTVLGCARCPEFLPARLARQWRRIAALRGSFLVPGREEVLLLMQGCEGRSRSLADSATTEQTLGRLLLLAQQADGHWKRERYYPSTVFNAAGAVVLLGGESETDHFASAASDCGAGGCAASLRAYRLHEHELQEMTLLQATSGGPPSLSISSGAPLTVSIADGDLWPPLSVSFTRGRSGYVVERETAAHLKGLHEVSVKVAPSPRWSPSESLDSLKARGYSYRKREVPCPLGDCDPTGGDDSGSKLP